MKVSTYMPNSKPQNNTVIEFDSGLCIWFSYKTPVAFRNPNMSLFIRENEWSNTTGRHLNAIDPDKSKRIPGETFEELLKIELWHTTRLGESPYSCELGGLRLQLKLLKGEELTSKEKASWDYLESKFPEGGTNI